MVKNKNLFAEDVDAPVSKTKAFRIIYSSISYDQQEILEAIRVLFLKNEQFEMDACFGYGNFYPTKEFPKFCFDLVDRREVNPNLVIGSAMDIPLDPMTVKSAILDPPFVVTSHVNSKEYVMGEKYGGFKTITELRKTYYGMLIEHYRVLKRGGILVFKCQDFIHGKKSYFISNEIYDYARAMGFKPIDKFILLSKNRFTGDLHKQQHARKFHCDFWVFQK